MPLKPGTFLGQYEILAAIGAGGMGEVYRANDTKLRREVALKVLPEAFSRDPERVARFRREAQLLAQLNHANIAAIYGLENSGGKNFLVLELATGETLRERILRAAPFPQSTPPGSGSHGHPAQRDDRGSVPSPGVPLDEALPIATQIAEALEHAHEKNIVHRDLKPANIKITPEGKVKVLDFGLAKAFAGEAVSSNPSESPTISAAATVVGQILGTPAYMSPEQARGKKVDKRTDIWAFGCVLYELLTGKQVFQSRDREGTGADTVQDILARVLQAEPDWSALPANTPPSIRTLLRRCLQKDITKRLRDATDVRIEIEETLAAPATPAPVPMSAPAPSPRSRWQRAMPLALALCAGAIIAGLAVWNLKPAPAIPKLATRTVVPLAGDQRMVASSLMPLAISPDGRHLVYAAQSGSTIQLYLREMDSLEARPLSGTEDADGPFFSPDGQWVGFFSDMSGSMKKVSISGGAVLTLSPGNNSRGASWGADDRIIFAPSANVGLLRISAAGGTPETLTHLNQGEATHRWPEILPGGKAVLFVAANGTNYDDAQIAVQRLDTGERKNLMQGGTFPHYVPTGHIIYYRSGTIMAVPFDLKRLEVTGSPAPVVEGVMSTVANSGGARFTVSNTGSLAYVPGPAQGSLSTMVWVDRKGVAEPLKAPPRPYGGNSGTRLSPDGQQVVIQIGNDLWTYSVARDTLTRLTFEGSNVTPAWTRDGKRVVYNSVKAGLNNLVSKPADGSGAEERLVASGNTLYPGSFTPDGRTLVYSENDPKTGRDILFLSLDGDPSTSSGQGRKPHVFLKTPFNETSARLSPDGHWLAYISDESGRYEIYVQPFPGPGGKWQISTEGGREMVWAANGEIFFRNGGKLMTVETKTQPTFEAGKPRLLFEGSYLMNQGVGANYDVTADGQRFIMLKGADQGSSATQINVVLNWFEELKQKVPVK